ncbi:hypothetical protein F7725_000066, partial [Dissostichus mawsoni]
MGRCGSSSKSDMEDILRKAAGSGNLIYQGKRIQLFPDYPPTLVNRRREFTPAREILRNKPDVRNGLFYPARLIVTHGGQQHSCTGLRQAFVVQSPLPSMTFCFLIRQGPPPTLSYGSRSRQIISYASHFNRTPSRPWLLDSLYQHPIFFAIF